MLDKGTAWLSCRLGNKTNQLKVHISVSLVYTYICSQTIHMYIHKNAIEQNHKEIETLRSLCFGQITYFEKG